MNCVLPVRGHGFESMAVYINNVDYYQPDKSLVLNPEKIAIAAKCAAIEPKIVLKNLFVQMAYNQQHQLAVAKQIAELIESNKQDIKLLVINNLTKFFKESKNKNYAANTLKEALGIFCRVHLRECSQPSVFKATLIKHQYAKTPKSVIINTRKTGRMLLLDR